MPDMTLYLQSLTAAIDDRPTNVQVHSMVQELSSDANRSIAAAEAAGQAAVAPLQHLMQDASVELEATKRQLAEVQDDLSRLQDWQVWGWRPNQTGRASLELYHHWH